MCGLTAPPDENFQLVPILHMLRAPASQSVIRPFGPVYQPGGFWVYRPLQQTGECRGCIKEIIYAANLYRFGGGSGGSMYICNDGMGATVTGNRHHKQRIRIQ